MANRTESPTALRDYKGPYLHIPLGVDDWTTAESPRPTFAVSLSRLPEPWEPLVCHLRNIVTDPETYTVEVNIFDFYQEFEWNPNDPTIKIAIPWGYLGLRSDGEYGIITVTLRDKQTGTGTRLEIITVHIYRDQIPPRPAALAPTPPLPRRVPPSRSRPPSLPHGKFASGRPALPDGAPALGTFENGGHFFGITVEQDGTAYKLYVAPRKYEMFGDLVSDTWAYDDPNHPLRRCIHRTDSRANTELLREYSPLARSVLDLDIDGVGDWAIPAVDVAELMFRNLHSGYRPWADEANVRDGENGTSWPRGLPYEDDEPTASALAAFRRFGDEAFHYYQVCHISTVVRPRHYAVDQLLMSWGEGPWKPSGIAKTSVRPVRRERFDQRSP